MQLAALDRGVNVEIEMFGGFSEQFPALFGAGKLGAKLTGNCNVCFELKVLRPRHCRHGQ